ncbi:MAG: quinone-dependent dihydroorotate dehydrogenase [Cytophagales bacterium]
MYRTILKPFLFKMKPEKAHHFTFFLLKLTRFIPLSSLFLKSIYRVESKKLEREIFGIKFPNPIGLAAGMDKNALVFNELANIGFGFIEIGTVTPKPQLGNPLPRLFRLPSDQALINRMGFNNDGVAAIGKRLKNRNKNSIVGGNIGKNKSTPNENAFDDYEICLRELYDYVDYFVVNVSSPNTPGLRELQEKEPLKLLLTELKILGNELAVRKKVNPKPILLKIAPDLTESQLDDIIEIVVETKIDGVIATNTTISRENLHTSSAEIEEIGAGGLSGKPVKDKSTEIIRYLHTKSKAAFPIIGVGGIHSAQDAIEKLNAGASLVQLYTGFVYEGPSLIREINKTLMNRNSL